MPTREELELLRALPLDVKVWKTEQRIREFVEHFGEDGVCVSFSGGKDSTVLLHLVRRLYPNVKAVYSDTGLEYPEIRNFVKTFDNVDWVKPKMTFGEIVTKYGYPLFSKETSNIIYYARKFDGKSKIKMRDELLGERQTSARRKKLLGELLADVHEQSIFNKQKYLIACQQLPFIIGSNCCHVMKKQPMNIYQHQKCVKPIIGTLTEESMMRTQGWLKTGCNSFDGKVMSKPLSFWTEQDILRYIKDNGIEICSVYGDIVAEDANGCQYADTLLPCGKLKCTGCDRTGCMYCAYGAWNEHKRFGKSRFERLAETHPKVYDFVLRGGKWIDNPHYDATAPKIDPVDGWENWNPKQIWVPGNGGLGMKFVFDEVNKLYNDYIRY